MVISDCSGRQMATNEEPTIIDVVVVGDGAEEGEEESPKRPPSFLLKDLLTEMGISDSLLMDDVEESDDELDDEAKVCPIRDTVSTFVVEEKEEVVAKSEEDDEEHGSSVAKAIFLAAVLMLVPLLLPLGENWVFLWVYNPWTGILWAGQSFDRLRLVYPSASRKYVVPGIFGACTMSGVARLWGRRLDQCRNQV